MIYNPLQEFQNKFKDLHRTNTERYLDELVTRAGVNIGENRKTVKQYRVLKEKLKKLRRKYNWWRFLRVLMILTLILIPLVILKITPKIRALREELRHADQKTSELLRLAQEQMEPLNALFSDRDALCIIEKTIPLLTFAPYLSVEQERNMIVNYDFDICNSMSQSTVDVLAGTYNENPFLFESRRTHTMGTEIYHGYRTISWTETYRDSNGKTCTRTRTQTLHASVTKPKPLYSTQVALHYCAQGGPDLSFSRDATHLERKSEREIERYVKRGEKRLKKKADQALRENRDFASMSNTDFEVLFDALDRTDEVQFRTLFTPLAQTNMVELLRSTVGYGDDFDFVKQKRANRIVSKHSQQRALMLRPEGYASYSFDETKAGFVQQNVAFFKAMYFDFAPLWAIPIYQERPVHALKPIGQHEQVCSNRECEALANSIPQGLVAHPQTKTEAILNTFSTRSRDGVDEICVLAYSYDKVPRVDFIPVFGGDGRMHSVPVPWQEYIPLESEKHFFVATAERAGQSCILAQRNGLCIFQ